MGLFGDLFRSLAKFVYDKYKLIKEFIFYKPIEYGEHKNFNCQATSEPPATETSNTRDVRRKNKIPVCPTKRNCYNKSCSNPSNFLCSACNEHMCATCNDPHGIQCLSCLRLNTMQEFKPCFNSECEKNYDCYLTTCKHIYHRACLNDWIQDNTYMNYTATSCYYCQEPFKLCNISSNFANPSAV